MTEPYLTEDDVSALEVLEAGGDLTQDQVGRLQALENTPFFAQTIQESEANSRRFAGAGFGPDGFTTSDAASPMVQAQPDPVPPTGGPVREDRPAPQQPAPQPADDGMQFDLVTPPPVDAVEMETNIRGPRLGAMGPVSEAGDFYRDDEELLEAIKSASGKGIVLTREEFQTGQELEEQIGDSIGNLKTGAGNILSGLWEIAKGAAVEQGASPAAAIGQALGSAAFDPTSAGKILVDGVKEATNRVVQGEVTKAEGARKAYIGVRQLWSWMEGTIENVEIDDDRRQAVRNDLIANKAFGQDNVANAQLLEAEVAKRREQGLAPFAPTDKTAEYDTKYRRYWENEKLNRAYTGQNQYILDGKVVDEKPDIALSQLVTGYNPATGEQIQPQPYTSMLYGMAMQPDTYVGFGAGYFSKLRVMSRAAAASRPLFGGIEVTAAKAAEAAKMGRDAQKFLRNSTIASGGLAATGLGLSLNDTTGTIGKGLLFFGGILPAMRATGFVLKRVPVANRFLEAGGILRPQALRIIAEESKAGPLGAGSAANTPATQAAAIRAARPASAERLAASGEVPQRYARFMGTQRTRQGDLKLQNAGQRGFDSTLKRVAQNPENPANVRRAARTADELGLTQAFRATDDALGGAIAGVVGSAPFAAIAPDDQTAGGILAAGASLGAAGGMVSSFTSFRGDAVDADIARFLADTDALGGDPKALFQMPHKHLAAMSSLQGTAANKGVDVVALRTEDYNRMVPEAIGSQGYFSAPTAKDGSKAGRQRIFVDLGHSSLEEGTARITQAPDGMFELTVVRKDGSVAYPLPAADGQPVIRRKSADEFTVKDGDPISPYVPLNRQPPRIVTASHEFIHALMKSDMFGGDHQPALRGLIYEQYKPETIQSMAREYAQRLVDAQINNGRVIKPTNDEAKAKLIDDMVTELEDASVSSTGDRRAWIADEIVAETWQDIAQTIDVNRIRQGKSADGRVVDAARSAMIVTTRALETFGMKFDWATGKPLTNPSTVFRDNPLATTPLLRKRILESVRNYDRYLTLLEDAGAVEAKGAPLPRSGRAEDWLAEGTMRVHRKADGTMENDVMTVDPDGQVRWKMQDQIDNEYKGRSTAVSDLLKRLGTKLVDDNDPTFGLRRAGVGRTIYSGAELPMSNSPLGYPPVLAAFPDYYRTMYRDAVESGRAGELVRLSNNTVGTRSDSGGPYQLSKLISSGFAKQSEGLFYGIQITKSGGHMNMQFVDTNAFKASALRAINDGQISFFNNDYKEVVRGLKQLMDNYRNKRDGSYMIGEEGKNILNGLLYGRSGANDGWGAKLNARGSIRTYRMDRMNWIERTGEDGYFFDNDRAKNNRMPETEPVDGPTMGGQAMPDLSHSSGYTLPPQVPERGHFLVGAKTIDGRSLEYKVDPRSVVQPPVKDINQYRGENVMVLEADRYNTLDGRMGGPLHPWLISNQVVVRTPDGTGYKAGWANMKYTFVSGARNKAINNTDNGRALIQVMADPAHRSGRDFVSRYMQKVDAAKSNFTSQQKDSLHVLLELGARMGQKGELTAPQKAFVKAMATVKSQNTRGNASGAENLFKKAMQNHSKSSWFRELSAKFANVSFTEEAATFTFPQRSSAMDKIDGLPFLPSLQDDLAASADFVGAKNLDVVASVQLSQNPDAFAVYFGKNSKEESKMTATERNLREQFLANKDFRVHPSYDWMMLSPENSDNFILEKPVQLETLFPWYRKAHPKASVKKGSPETVAGAMRKYGGIKLKL